MKKIGSFISTFIFSLLLVLVAQVFSQASFAGVTVKAVVDRNKINRGETIVLSVVVSSDQSISVSEPRLPNLNGFQLVNKWSGTEARSTFSNGRFQTVRTRKFNYQLKASQVGRFKIGAVDVVASGKSLRTKSIGITVVRSGAPSPRLAAPSRPTFADPFAEADDLFNQLLGRKMQRRGRSGNKAAGVAPENMFWIDVEVDKKTAFEGEQVTATWYLYTHGQIRDIDTLNYPSLSGFWKEDIEVATHLNFKREIVNGIMVKKALLASYALFPIKSGKVLIDQYIAKITGLAQNRGFGFGRPVQAVKKSRTVSVSVLPLPEGKPANFVGVVGNFDVSVQIENRSVPVNQPVTVKVKFEGRGNAKLIELPKLNLPIGLEVYDTKKESKFYKTGHSIKEFELLLIPRVEGKIIIPELKFSIFDPANKSYREISGQSISLTILPGDEKDEVESPLAQATGVVERIKKDPMPRVMLAWKSHSGPGVFQSPLVWLFLFFSSASVLFLRAKRELNWGAGQRSVAAKVKARFDKVSSLIKQGDWRGVGVETTNTVYFALGEVAGEGGANIELDKLMLKFPPSVRRDMGPEIRKLMEVFQTISFAPEEVVGDLKNKENMKKIVKDIERLILQALKVRTGDDDSEGGK